MALDDDTPPATRVGQQSQSDMDDERAICCRRCRHTVTHARFEVEAAGRQTHRLMNPAGVIFVVRCFSQAEGAAVVGRASDEYTWFPPFAWRYAHCAGCGTHLGWAYDAEAAFFGLNDEALIDS